MRGHSEKAVYKAEDHPRQQPNWPTTLAGLGLASLQNFEKQIFVV